MRNPSIPEARHRRRTVSCSAGALNALCCLVCALLALSCSAFTKVEEITSPDLRPPQLVSVRVVSERSFELCFDEPATVEADEALLEPERGELTSSPAERTVTVHCALPMEPGACHLFEAVASDEHGNCLSFMTQIYGYNPNVPDMVINEFITNGSTTHPDLVELAVLSPGSLGGVCLAVGTPEAWDARMVLPDVAVTPGEFVLVHCKPLGDPAEVDEVEDRTASGGADASPDAWDYWMPGGTGLSGNNGVLTLSRSPGGLIMDAVIYSNRTSESDDRYRGFGSTQMMEWVDAIVDTGAWAIELEAARPEDAVDPSDSTSTRSICRSSASADSDSRIDWHIVPTRGSTFGSVNGDEVYTP